MADVPAKPSSAALAWRGEAQKSADPLPQIDGRQFLATAQFGRVGCAVKLAIIAALLLMFVPGYWMYQQPAAPERRIASEGPLDSAPSARNPERVPPAVDVIGRSKVPPPAPTDLGSLSQDPNFRPQPVDPFRMQPLDNGLPGSGELDAVALSSRTLSSLNADDEASAQFNLGVIYEEGRGVPKDAIEAAKWYRLAAEQGHAGAQAGLAAMYADGRGVAKDEAEALHWFHKAAEQGHVDALMHLRAAAEQGSAVAQDYLAQMYEHGRGVAKDEVEAEKWHRKATDAAKTKPKANSDGRGGLFKGRLRGR